MNCICNFFSALSLSLFSLSLSLSFSPSGEIVNKWGNEKSPLFHPDYTGWMIGNPMDDNSPWQTI